MKLRILEPSDAPAMESFLSAHRDSSMFLRSNSRKVGLVYQDAPSHALYVAALRDDRIVGIVAHAWNGMLLVQAPEGVEDLARACVRWSKRRVNGILGPLEQVRGARRALDLEGAKATLDDDESLFGLDLEHLVVPKLLAHGGVSCRPPHPAEREQLLAWRMDYDMEALGIPKSAINPQRTAELLDAQLADGNVWIAVDHGNAVSLAAFNAALPDIVQLGGIYTPPPLRGRGYAKAAVAAALLNAAQRGVTRSVLFTDNPSAVRCYEALGFEKISDFGLLMFG